MSQRDQRRILELLRREPKLTHPEMRFELDLSKGRVMAALAELLRKGTVRIVGSGAPREFALAEERKPTPPPKPVAVDGAARPSGADRAARPVRAGGPVRPAPVPHRPAAPPDRPSARSASPAEDALPDDVSTSAVGGWSIPKGCPAVSLRDGESRVADFYPKRLRRR